MRRHVRAVACPVLTLCSVFALLAVLPVTGEGFSSQPLPGSAIHPALGCVTQDGGVRHGAQCQEETRAL